MPLQSPPFSPSGLSERIDMEYVENNNRGFIFTVAYNPALNKMQIYRYDREYNVWDYLCDVPISTGAQNLTGKHIVYSRTDSLNQFGIPYWRFYIIGGSGSKEV